MGLNFHPKHYILVGTAKYIRINNVIMGESSLNYQTKNAELFSQIQHFLDFQHYFVIRRTFSALSASAEHLEIPSFSINFSLISKLSHFRMNFAEHFFFQKQCSKFKDS